MITKVRVTLSFGGLPDDTFITFATGVHTLLYASPVYSTPPVSAPSLQAAIEAFSDAKVAQPNSGKAGTALKNVRRAALIALLEQLANYVQGACSNSLPLLLDSGFGATSFNRAQVPLAKPAIRRIVPGMSGQSLVTLEPDPNSKVYEVMVAELDESGAPGPYRAAVIRTSSRNIPVNDLVPGKLYAFQGRAVGGATGFSDWSDVLVQRAA